MIDKLTIAQGFKAMYYFLDGLSTKEPSSISSEEMDQLCMLLGTMDNDPAAFQDWVDSLSKFVALNKLTQQSEISVQSIFSAVNEFCTLYNDKFAYTIPTVLNILLSLQSNHASQTEEWTLWCRSLELASVEIL